MAHFELLLSTDRNKQNHRWSNIITKLAKQEYKYHTALGKLTILKYKYAGNGRIFNVSKALTSSHKDAITPSLPSMPNRRNFLGTFTGLHTFNNRKFSHQSFNPYCNRGSLNANTYKDFQARRQTAVGIDFNQRRQTISISKFK